MKDKSWKILEKYMEIFGNFFFLMTKPGLVVDTLQLKRNCYSNITVNLNIAIYLDTAVYSKIIIYIFESFELKRKNSN